MQQDRLDAYYYSDLYCRGMEDELDYLEEEIALKPFAHQVGGHSSVMLLNEWTICKPLINREKRFYESIPREIEQFTPQYKGVIEVSFIQNNDGLVGFVAHPPRKPTRQRRKSNSSMSSGESCNSGSDSDSESQQSSPRRSKHCLDTSRVCDDYLRKSLLQSFSHLHLDNPNPWTLKFQQNQLTKMYKASSTNNVHKFILLENMASHFHRPCILDLKMGTRQHGDDAPVEKQKSQIAKCAATTSSSLGIRLCGMQVYQESQLCYIFKDKYHGRTLSEEGFKQAIYQFLHNGYCLRTELLPSIIHKLRKLLRVIEKQNSYRFYSSSLLIMYEGNRSKTLLDNEPRIEIRMIDFAHTTYEGYIGDKTVHRGPDKGYLFGIENLLRILEEIQSEEI